MLKTSKTSVNLNRLLRRCETYPLEELQADADRRRFRANVDSLDVLLGETTKNGLHDAADIANYTQRINTLKKLVDLDKLRSPIELSLSKSRPMAYIVNSQGDRLAQLEREVRMQRAVQEEQRSELLYIPSRSALASPADHVLSSIADETTTANLPAISELRQRRAKRSSLLKDGNNDTDEATQMTLERHATLQQQMTDNLLSMASQLKNNSLAFADVLRKDERILKDAQSSLHRNVTKLERESGRLKKHSVSSRRMTYMIWLLLAFVVFAFAGVYTVIRLFPKSR